MSEFIDLAQYVTYGLGRPAEERKANRAGYQAAYEEAKSSGRGLYQNAGDLELELDPSGDSEGGFVVGIRLDGDVHIVGAGIHRTRLKFFPDTPTFNAYAFYQGPGRHNRISDCTITGPAHGTDEPDPLFYGIKHQGEPDARVIADESLALSNVKVDGKFCAALTSNEGDLVCTLDGCDFSAYVQAVGYFVNVDTHKQLIIRNNCHFHDSGLHGERAALVYVSPGVAIDISRSRFSASQRFGVYINGNTTVRPLYSRITDNVFEETLARAIQVAGNNRPLIRGNRIGTHLCGVQFFGARLGAEVLDNEFIQPPCALEPYRCISGDAGGRGALVKVHGNTLDAGAGAELSQPTSLLDINGDGTVWDVEGNVFRLNHEALSGIVVGAGNVLAFMGRNKFTGARCATCMQFGGGTVYARGNVIETASGNAFRLVEDTLVKAYLDDNEVAAPVRAFDISLTEASDGKMSGGGNRFLSDRAQFNPAKDFKYQLLAPGAGLCPTAVPSAPDTLLPVSYDTFRVTGGEAIDNLYLGNSDFTRLFGGEVRLVFDGGARTTGAGNIRPETVEARAPSKVYRFVRDPLTGRWYE